MKHTPGPWNVSDIGLGFISRGSLEKGWKGMIAQADVGNYASSIDEGRANARLIAAAPELLEALKELLLLTEPIFPEISTVYANDCRKRVEQAIAKAEAT